MNFPTNLKYTKDHAWVLFEGGIARIGLTRSAIDTFGSIVYINLPDEGDTVVYGESFGDVESTEAVVDIISPLSGTVSAVNADVADNAEIVNDDPYDCWLLEISDITGQDELLDANEYESLCAEEI